MKICDDLRAAVLQAAMKGQLSKTQKNDGKIEDVINECKIEKTKAIADGKFRNEDFKGSIVDDIPYEIPSEWRWLHISDMSLFQEGPGILAVDFRPAGVPLIRIAGMQTQFVSLDGCNYLDEEMVNDRWKHFKLDYGDILISSSASMDKVCEVKEEAVGAIPYTGQIRFKMYAGINKEYFVYFVKSPFYIQQINEQKAGGTIKHYGPTHLRKMLIPVPPIEEQHRIVAKVDELMAKIDELEKIENQLESLKKDFPGDMKAALLQSAMQGKLTEQLEDDGDAVGLAEVIKAERNKLGKNKYIKGNIEDANIPDSWTAIKSGECFSLEKGTNVKEVSLPYLEAKYLRGKVSATMMTEGEFVSKGEKVILVDGENSGEVFIEPEDGIIGSTFKVLFIPESINEKYALYFLDMYRDQFRNNKKGAAIPHLNKDIFNNLLLPIPPIEEQRRIVEKLDQLLPLCDGLCEEKLQEAM